MAGMPAKYQLRDLALSGAIAAALVFASACTYDPPTTVRTLHSGLKVEVVSMRVIDGPDPTWVIEYRTRIPLSERLRLQCEALSLWDELRTEADGAGVKQAGVWPNNFRRELRFDGWKPVVLSHMSTAFSLKKDDTGSWVRSGGWEAGHCSE